MKLEDYIERFVAELNVAGMSERTIDCYGRHSREFIAFLRKYYPRITRWSEVGKDVIRDYQDFLGHTKMRNGRPLANTSVRLKLTAVKQLFSYLLKQDYVLNNPSTVIVSPKEEQRLPRNILSEKEMLELLRSIKPRDPVSMRNRAIVELLYSCGIRTSELCSLKIADVDLNGLTVTIVKGKGGKTRVVPIGQYAAHYLETYLTKARRTLLKGIKYDSGTMFLSSRGNPFTRSTLNRAVMESIRRAVPGDTRITCYTFRHSVATHLVSRNVDIAHIAQLLGHASFETTKRYLRIEIGDLKRIHASFHPREARSDTN